MDDARPGLNIMDNNETLSDQNYFLLRAFDCQTAVSHQISVLIRTNYGSSLKFIIAFERRMRKNTQFYTHGSLGDEEKLPHPLKLNTISCVN